MSELIDRVARAIEDASDGLVVHSGETLARAAIAALRDPTDAMVDAGVSRSSLFSCSCEETIVYEAWQGMIDAALAVPK